MNTQNAAVIGHPIRHTMSPFIHKRLFALHNTPMNYRVEDVEDLSAYMQQAKKINVFNVTIPYKEKIIPFLDELDDKAKLFGSVNTVEIKNGRTKGYITDGTGCLQAIESEGVSTCGRTLILGNGGTARAIAFEMAYENPNFNITLAHRKLSAEKAQKIAEDIMKFSAQRATGSGSITCMLYEELINAGKFDLLINATNVGMFPNVEASPVTEEFLHNCAAVFDAVFNPEETKLLQLAKSAGTKTIKGIGMLVRQAVAAHGYWYGVSFREEDIRELCKDATKEMNRIFYGELGEND